MSEEPKTRVLWIDDDVNYLLWPLRRVLEQEGIHISTAVDSQTAIELLRMEKFDVLLVDLILLDPRTESVSPYGGLELVEDLKNTLKADTPIVGLSAVHPAELGKERERFASYFDKVTLLEKGVLNKLIACLKHGGRTDESKHD